MAENISETQRQLSEAMAAVQRDMAAYGQVTRETAEQKKDAEMKAKYGINNFTAGVTQASTALTSLGSALLAGAKAMAEGKKGAAAMNGAMDELATAATAAGAALAFMIPGGIIVKAFVAAVSAGVVAQIRFNQMTLEMVDKLHKGYQGMARSGAAASDGMTGLFNDAKKLGLSMGELDGFVSLVAEHSQDFALFAGSVSEGRKQFADMGGALKSSRVEFFNMGMTTQDVNAGMASFLRLQGRTGQAQKMTTDQLAAGAKAYMLEMDGLAKLTGQNKKDLEDQRMKMLNHSKAAATLRLMERNGNVKGAEALKSFTNMMGTAGPGVQDGIMAMLNGSLSDPEAQKLFRGSAGEARVVIDLIKSQQISAVEGAQRLSRALGNVSEGMLENASVNSAYGDTFTAVAEAQRARVTSDNDLVKQEQKMLADRAAQKAGTDALTASQSALILKQIEANESLERMMLSNAGSAQAFAQKLTDASEEAANQLMRLAEAVKEILGTLLGFTGEVKPLSQVNTAQDDINFQKANVVEKASSGLARGLEHVGDMIGSVVGLGSEGGGNFFKNMANKARESRIASETQYMKDKESGALEHRAAGGPVNRSTPYLVGENGPEIFVPKDAGDIVPNSRLGAGAAIGDNFSAAIDDMYKDVKTQEKTLDADTQRQKQFSDLQKHYFDTYGGFMKDVIEQVDNNDPKDSSSSIGRMFSGLFGGSTGLQMPSGAGMTNMGGAQGMQGPESHSAVGGGGQGINAPKLASVRSKTGKSAEVNAEYAPRFQSLIDYLDSIGYEINSLGGYVDRDVRGKPGVKSVHAKGGAIDINPGSNPMGGQLMTDLPENISAIAKGLGLGWGGNWAAIKDAMHFSVAANEGGDIKLSDGGVAVGPNSGYRATLHGEEAVIPLNNGGGNFVKLFESMADSNSRMVGMLEELVRAQKNGNDISNKMLRMQT
jgi:hypothetical protein